MIAAHHLSELSGYDSFNFEMVYSGELVEPGGRERERERREGEEGGGGRRGGGGRGGAGREEQQSLRLAQCPISS